MYFVHAIMSSFNENIFPEMEILRFRSRKNRLGPDLVKMVGEG